MIRTVNEDTNEDDAQDVLDDMDDDWDDEVERTEWHSWFAVTSCPEAKLAALEEALDIDAEEPPQRLLPNDMVVRVNTVFNVTDKNYSGTIDVKARLRD